MYIPTYSQRCQMAYYQTKNPNMDTFLRALDWLMVINCIAIGYILLTFGIFYDHLVHFVFIGHIFFGFGITHHKNLATLMYWKKFLQTEKKPIGENRNVGECTYKVAVV
jgi:hypothetical protein